MTSPLSESFVFPSPGVLTDAEQMAKDMLIYVFEPVLKYIFDTVNPEEFKRYAFNTCRQTAVLGAYYLRKLLPGYHIQVFEAQCHDVLSGQEVDYVHAFFTATSPAGKHILIDISRTVKRLLFHPFDDWSDIYPSEDEWSTFQILDIVEIDLDEALNLGPEYLTGWDTRYLLDQVTDGMRRILDTSPQDFTNFYCHIYSSVTAFKPFILDKHYKDVKNC